MQRDNEFAQGYCADLPREKTPHISDGTLLSEASDPDAAMFARIALRVNTGDPNAEAVVQLSPRCDCEVHPAPLYFTFILCKKAPVHLSRGV